MEKAQQKFQNRQIKVGKKDIEMIVKNGWLPIVLNRKYVSPGKLPLVQQKPAQTQPLTSMPVS